METSSNELSNTPDILRIKRIVSHFTIFTVIDNTIGSSSLELLICKEKSCQSLLQCQRTGKSFT